MVRAEGRSFCAGAHFRSDDAPDPTQGTSFETQTGALPQRVGHPHLRVPPVPLVAAVHGAAIGAGFGLALACDVCVTGRGGWFQANFVRLGIHPGFALSTTSKRSCEPARTWPSALPNSRRLFWVVPGAASGAACEAHWPVPEGKTSAQRVSGPPKSAWSRVNQSYCSGCVTAPRLTGGGRLLAASARASTGAR